MALRPTPDRGADPEATTASDPGARRRPRAWVADPCRTVEPTDSVAWRQMASISRSSRASRSSDSNPGSFASVISRGPAALAVALAMGKPRGTASARIRAPASRRASPTRAQRPKRPAHERLQQPYGRAHALSERVRRTQGRESERRRRGSVPPCRSPPDLTRLCGLAARARMCPSPRRSGIHPSMTNAGV